MCKADSLEIIGKIYISNIIYYNDNFFSIHILKILNIFYNLYLIEIDSNN